MFSTTSRTLAYVCADQQLGGAQQSFVASVQVPVPHNDRLRFVPEAVRSVEPIQMGSNCVGRDRQASRDFLVGHPLRREAQDLTLPLRDTQGPRHCPLVARVRRLTRLTTVLIETC